MGNSQRIQRNNNAIVEARRTETQTPDGTLQLLKGRMAGMDAEVNLLQTRFSSIHAEKLELERRADEAISTCGKNVQEIMLFHSLASIFLQINYPYVGRGVSLLMILSFFSAFMVPFTTTFNKMERMFKLERDLQSRQRVLQNDVTYLGAKIERACWDQESETLASNLALGGVMDKMFSLKRNVDSLEKAISGTLELSNSNEIRMKSLLQIAGGAAIYGLCFPLVAYCFLCLFGFRKTVLSI